MHREDDTEAPAGLERCSHCLHPVPPDLGVENSLGQILCGSCYLVLWPTLAKRADLAAEAPGLSSG